MKNENLELDFILDFYDITEDCGCSENLWCQECLSA